LELIKICPIKFIESKYCNDALLKLVLNLDEFLIDSEVDLLLALIKWIKRNFMSENENDEKKLKELIKPYLEYIRFPTIPPKELVKDVKPLKLIPDEIYFEALEHQATKEESTLTDKKYIPRVIKKIEFGFGNYSHR
jgi:hypothetical protein